MTNTLTGNFKPIQLPKLNTNWLSVISLIVLCTTVFVTINTAAEACEDLKLSVAIAKLAADAALDAADLAFKALEWATENDSEALIFLATEAVELAISIATIAVNYHVQLSKELHDCLKNIKMASGSCNSGGCS